MKKITTKKITIVSLEKHKGNSDLHLVDEVEFIKEPNNPKDKDAIRVVAKGQTAGYVANNEHTLKKDSISATELKKSLKEGVTIKLVELEEIPEDKKWKSFLARVEIITEEKKEDKDTKEEDTEIYTYRLSGSQALYPERIPVLKDFSEGKDVNLSIKEVDGDLEVTTKNGPIGIINKNNNDYDKLYKIAKNTRLTAKLSKETVVRSIKIDVDLSSAASIFKKEIQRIVDQNILTEEEVKERISYLLHTVKAEEKVVGLVLKDIKPLKEGEKVRTTTPKTKFIEYNHYFTDSIICKSKNKYLRYVGGKATGKNTCAETLAWLYNRPVAEVAINEGIDKIDLTGSRIIDSDEDGNLKMPFDLSTFATALEKGWFVIVDEINTASASLLTIFHGLDSRRRLDIPGYGTVKVHPEAMVILTMNEEYVGTMPLNEATADRFTPIVFEDARDITGMLKAAVPEAEEDDIKRCQTFYRILKNLHSDGKISSYPISIRGFVDALEVCDFMGLQRAIKRNVVDKGVDAEERISLDEQLKLLFE
jgi:hypothetical protein